MTVLRMVRPTLRKGSTVYQFRPRVPADILEKVRGDTMSLIIGGKPRPIKINERITVTLATKDPHEAKLRALDVMSQIKAYFEQIRNVPPPLSHRQRIAFAGAMRAYVIGKFDEEPLKATEWKAFAPIAGRLLSGELVDKRVNGDVLSPEKAVVSFFEPTIKAVSLLSGIQPSPADYEALVPEMVRAMNEAAEVTLRKAEGDYTPDEGAKKYPSLDSPKVQPENTADILTLSALFAIWERDHRRDRRSEKTISDYAGKIEAFKAFMKHENAIQINNADVGRWAQYLLNDIGLSSSTVYGKYIAAIGSVFSAGINAGVYEKANPATGGRKRKVRKVSTRSRGYSSVEAARILKASLSDPSLLGRRPEKTKLAIRWGPWICAHTGCRVTEAMQLRKQDLVTHEGVLCLNINPDAGSVKGGQFRYIPVHSQLLELGLERLFSSARAGPLFFPAKATREEAHKAAQNIGAKISKWIRASPDLNVPNVASNHGWRHRFKTVAADVGIEERHSRAIMGHSGIGVADNYGTNTMRSLKLAIDKMPYYDIG